MTAYGSGYHGLWELGGGGCSAGCAADHWWLDRGKVTGGMGGCGVPGCLGLGRAGCAAALCSGSRLTGRGGRTLTGAGLGGGEGRLTCVGEGASTGGLYFLRNFLFLFVAVLEPSILTV